jgi:metal-sulfur cluster biosynthetic enzyme
MYYTLRMATKTTSSRVYQLLATVMDPELHIDIVALGLIYDVVIRQMANVKTQIHVTMTLTTPGCPLAPVIDRMIKEALEPLGAEVELELVWDPPWTKEMMWKGLN